MELLNLLKDRFSARIFLNKTIEKEKLDKIMEAGRVAPTTKNMQPQKVYVISSKAGLEKINSVSPCIYNAPLVMLVCADMNSVWQGENGENSAEIDCSIVCTQMMLEAKSLGIDSCWVLLFDKQKTKELFNLPENIKPICLLDLGYSNAEPSLRHTDKKALSEMFEII